jgi:putative FmdB family regulatory protein
MPLYDFWCPACGYKAEMFKHMNIDVECPNCKTFLKRGPGSFAMSRIKGQGYPSRRKWMDNWTPDSPPFQVGSLHGEKY